MAKVRRASMSEDQVEEADAKAMAVLRKQMSEAEALLAAAQAEAKDEETAATLANKQLAVKHKLVIEERSKAQIQLERQQTGRRASLWFQRTADSVAALIEPASKATATGDSPAPSAGRKRAMSAPNIGKELGVSPDDGARKFRFLPSKKVSPEDGDEPAAEAIPA